jgi:hypothetical protein
MTAADHSHPELERILERQTALLEQQGAALDRHERILGRLVDLAEITTITLRDIAAVQRDMATRLERVETLAQSHDLTLQRIEARLGSIEDALRGPGRN